MESTQFTLSGNNLSKEQKKKIIEEMKKIAVKHNLEPQCDGDLVYVENFNT